MLKRIINHATIDLRIAALDPLLIKSGQATVGGVNMAFVRTYRLDGESRPYIPGSSLKGMVRSYAEKICRSLRENPVPVCLPYAEPGNDQPEASCGLHFDKFKKDPRLTSREVYRYSCPTCRLFGSHAFVGRFAASDGLIDETEKHLLEIRDGVAIDRITGGAAPRAKYDLEVLTRGVFKTTIELRNFERWQLGLIGLVLQEMEAGLVRLGFGKSRGLGRIETTVERFCISYYNREVTGFLGLASLCSAEERGAYGLFNETASRNPVPMPEPGPPKGLRREYDVTSVWKELLNPAVEDLKGYLACIEWPRSLEGFIGTLRKQRREP